MLHLFSKTSFYQLSESCTRRRQASNALRCEQKFPHEFFMSACTISWLKMAVERETGILLSCLCRNVNGTIYFLPRFPWHRGLGAVNPLCKKLELERTFRLFCLISGEILAGTSAVAEGNAPEVILAWIINNFTAENRRRMNGVVKGAKH